MNSFIKKTILTICTFSFLLLPSCSNANSNNANSNESRQTDGYYSLTIASNIDEAGIISGDGEYEYNTYVDVSAYPNQGYKFIGWYWQNTLLSNSEKYKFMMPKENVTLEARFKAASFLMNVHSNNQDYGLVLLESTFNNNYVPEYQEYLDYKMPVKIAAYSKTNVRFLGWFDSDNKLVSTNALYSFTMPNHDYTLEAKWNYFTIDYVLNGGTNASSNPTSYTIDSNKILLSNPTRTGYDFTGWTYNGKAVTEVDPTWNENITLVANWRSHTYSITYELYGGINNPSNPITYTIESDTITLKDPSRNGYNFSGWYTDSNFSNQITLISNGSYGNLIIYAKWTPIVYSITYNLNGGVNAPSNPSTYTIESSFNFSGATKTGYQFAGWYDEEGNAVTSISAGTTGALTLTADWNDGNEYVVTLDANGGQVSETLINVQYDQKYSLPDATRLGYTFNGWYEGSSKINSAGIWKYATNKTLVAKWTIIDYPICYTLNGGTNNSRNPSSYTIEDNITFSDPGKTGYTFLGWYAGDNVITGIPRGNTGTVNVEAKWSANLHALSVISEDSSKGIVSITSGSGYSGELITVIATPVGDCVFKGWYHKNTKVSDDTTYTFTMPTNDYSLVAHFITKSEEEEKERAIKYATNPILSEDGKTIKYGLYPQKNVNDSLLVSALNSLTTPEPNGWYLYNHEYYAKEVAKPHYQNKRFDNETTIIEGTTYWFKCEPIIWNILSKSNSEYYILSSVLLDTHCYYQSTSNRTKDGKIIFSNNYEYSDIRTWLNDDFFNSAFALGNSHIQTATVNNSGSTTDSSVNPSASNNTLDKVFLPSYQDYINSSYGFSTSTDSTNTRYCQATDWAKARTADSNYTEYSYLSNGNYWTRSPCSGYVDTARFVHEKGGIYRKTITTYTLSVRPSLLIKIA